jgi:alpha-tubulin suppressor-like RCC1 family protein
LIKGLWPDQITAISAGAGHSLVLNFQGRVYSFGYNGHGQLGLGKKGNKDSPTLIPISCPQMEEIIAISAGTFHSLILNDQGQVLSFGANKDGRLGLGDQKGRLAPTLIESFEKIDPPGSARVVAISAGGRHSLFLTHQGQVFSCGYNRYGQLGLSDDASRLVPTLIDSLENRKIIAISAGGTHSLLLDSRGRVFSFGNNHYGQLGLKKNGRNLLSCPDKVCLPTKINLTIEIVGISTGISYSLFLDSQGRIFSCGNNGSGQLGLGDEILRLAPTLIPDFVI